MEKTVVCNRTSKVCVCSSVWLLLIRYSFHISARLVFCFKQHMYYKLLKDIQSNTECPFFIYFVYLFSFTSFAACYNLAVLFPIYIYSF